MKTTILIREMSGVVSRLNVSANEATKVMQVMGYKFILRPVKDNPKVIEVYGAGWPKDFVFCRGQAYLIETSPGVQEVFWTFSDYELFRTDKNMYVAAAKLMAELI